jgi:hypothetical protein
MASRATFGLARLFRCHLAAPVRGDVRTGSRLPTEPAAAFPPYGLDDPNRARACTGAPLCPADTGRARSCRRPDMGLLYDRDSTGHCNPSGTAGQAIVLAFPTMLTVFVAIQVGSVWATGNSFATMARAAGAPI